MRRESPDQKGKPGCTQRCAVLILALLTVSPVLSAQTSPARQVQHLTKKEVEKKGTEHSICYAVQVGAYKERVEVGAMLDKLAQEFPNRMMLTQVGTRDKTRWRLRVLATSRVEAFKVSERLLAEQGVHPWIVPVPCIDWTNGRLGRAILAPHPETPEPASPVLMKKEAVLIPREARVSTIAPQTESPAPLSTRMVWMMTIATFLDTAFFVLLICMLYFQRERPEQMESHRRH